MLSKLGITQDLFAELQAISVLLVLITPLETKAEKTRKDQRAVHSRSGHIDLADVMHRTVQNVGEMTEELVLVTAGQSSWDFGPKTEELVMSKR